MGDRPFPEWRQKRKGLEEVGMGERDWEGRMRGRLWLGCEISR